MTKTYKICTLPGDGIGPEIMAEGVKVLKALGEKYDVDFACEDALIGGCAIDASRVCSAFVRRWACIPTCAPFRFSTHWPRPLP